MRQAESGPQKCANQNGKRSNNYKSDSGGGGGDNTAAAAASLPLSSLCVSPSLSLALLCELITYAIVVVLCGLVSVYRLVSLIDLMEN